MKTPSSSFSKLTKAEALAEQRKHLSLQIAEQRHELGMAFQSLYRPISSINTTIQAAWFLRAHPYIPGLGALIFSFLVGRLAWGGRSRSRLAAASSSAAGVLSAEASAGKRRSFIGHLFVWAGRLLKAFQIYRRYRSLVP